MTLADAALRGALVALLLLLAVALRRDWRGSEPGRIAAVLCLGLAVQMVGSAPAIEWHWPPAWQAPLVAVAVGNAVLFWLFVRALFDDEFRLQPMHGTAWAAAAVLGAFNAAVMAGSDSPLVPWTFGAQRVVAVACALAAAWAVLRSWRADLVEPRRRLRGFVAGLGIVYTLLQAAFRISSGTGMMTESTALADVALMLVLVGVVALRLVRLDPGELLAPAPAASPAPAGTALAAEPDTPPPDPAQDAADARLAETLLEAMNRGRAYAEEDLSLPALAGRLGVPEYRLRRIINRRLGHRNFNAFVNRFRLDEAKAALADPARRNLPVLTIALSAGFQSIGPFNRAFKTDTGLTPTEFRKEKLADS